MAEEHHLFLPGLLEHGGAGVLRVPGEAGPEEDGEEGEEEEEEGRGGGGGSSPGDEGEEGKEEEVTWPARRSRRG